MHAEVKGGDGAIEIRLKGKLTFDAHQIFNNVVEDAVARSAREIHVDFSEVEDVNSAGLGMLLLLHKKARSAGKAVRLTQCCDATGKAMWLANFQKLFAIESPQFR
jgi:anti-anti-sigma factor